MGYQAAPQTLAFQAMQERLKTRLLELRALLDAQSAPCTTAACIAEIDRIEQQMLALAGPRRRSQLRDDELPEQGCDPWISVSF